MIWPYQCRCGHLDADHEQDDDRFGACQAKGCMCPGLTTKESV